MASGVVLNGVATGMYIGAGLGPGPRDGLMTGFAARGHSLRVVRTCIEATVLLVGWLLGGTVGVGTVAYAVCIGPLAHIFVPLFSRPLTQLLEPRLRQVHDRRAVANRQAGGTQRRRRTPCLRAKVVIGAAKLGSGFITARSPVPVVDEYLAGQARDIVEVVHGYFGRLIRTRDEVLQHLDLFVEFGDGAATSASGIPLGKGRPDPRAAVQRLLALDDDDQTVDGLAHQDCGVETRPSGREGNTASSLSTVI
jgi:hypothetical protein